MKSRYALIPFAVFACVAAASAQTTIYRCGNTYTNDRAEAQSKNCKAVEGGNVTVVQGTKVNPAAAAGGTSVASAPQAAPRPASQRVEANDQKSRDSEARSILEAELKKAQARQAELEKEYNGGQPEMLGPEHKNHQKYLDRVADMKAALDRNTRDIEGLTRELARSGGATASSGNGGTTAK
jgi:hypothetical protein